MKTLTVLFYIAALVISHVAYSLGEDSNYPTWTKLGGESKRWSSPAPNGDNHWQFSLVPTENRKSLKMDTTIAFAPILIDLPKETLAFFVNCTMESIFIRIPDISGPPTPVEVQNLGGLFSGNIEVWRKDNKIFVIGVGTGRRIKMLTFKVGNYGGLRWENIFGNLTTSYRPRVEPRMNSEQLFLSVVGENGTWLDAIFNFKWGVSEWKDGERIQDFQKGLKDFLIPQTPCRPF